MMCYCKVLTAIISLMFISAECIVTLTCPPGYYTHLVGASEKCCKFCPPGTFLSRHCSKDNNSECLECPENYYTDRANNYKQCISCTECSGKTYLKKHCTKTEDTICKCIDGYFYKSISSTCERCKDCNIGQGVVTDCTHSTQRICQPCIEGVTFSKRKNGKCLPCLQCGVNEIKTSNCTVYQNAKCRMAPVPKQPTDSMNITVIVIITVTLLFFTILVAAILILRKRITINCCFFGGGHPTPISSVDRRAPRPSAGVPEEAVQLRVDCPSSNSRRERPIEFKDLDYAVVETLVKLLTPRKLRHKNWKTLAGLLSYNHIDIAEFEREQCPAERLFLEYLTLPDPSIERLYNLFIKMKRLDCARILKPFIFTESAEV